MFRCFQKLDIYIPDFLTGGNPKRSPQKNFKFRYSVVFEIGMEFELKKHIWHNIYAKPISINQIAYFTLSKIYKHLPKSFIHTIPVILNPAYKVA